MSIHFYIGYIEIVKELCLYTIFALNIFLRDANSYLGDKRYINKTSISNSIYFKWERHQCLVYKKATNSCFYILRMEKAVYKKTSNSCFIYFAWKRRYIKELQIRVLYTPHEKCSDFRYIIEIQNHVFIYPAKKG